MLEIVIMILMAVMGFLAGVAFNNKARLETEQRYSKLAISIKERDKLISKQRDKLTKLNNCLLDIVRECERNSYNNEQTKISNIKELVKTAIKN